MPSPARILCVSCYLPYASVAHAGGRTHYHYVRGLATEPEFQVSVVGFVAPDELPRIKPDGEAFPTEVLVYPRSLVDRLLHKAWRAWLRVAPRAAYGGVLPPVQEGRMLAALRRWRTQHGEPDLIILEWAQMVLLAPKIKVLFPRSRLVASEHDCLFQWAARTHQESHGAWRRRVLAGRAAYVKQIEVAALRQVDLVLVQSGKDANLLAAEGVDPRSIQVIVPKFHALACPPPRASVACDVLFFGAMDRVENYSACLWFIDEVLPVLRQRVPGARLVVLGAKPHPSLARRASEAVEITGFVADIVPYFERALCLVAPLRLGAGIKVKVLEGMAAGRPVLTNAVGIEGIPAQPGSDYLHCESARDYVDAVAALAAGTIDGSAMGARGARLIREKFDLAASFQALRTRLQELAKR